MIQPPITEFISNLKDEGYVLHVENGRLKVIHPSRPLDDTARQFIREYKPDIVHALTREAPGPDTTPADTPQSPDLVFKKTPPPPAKVAKPAKLGGKTGDFSNFSNFSKPIPGFLKNPDPSPDDVESTVPIPEDTPADTVDTPAQEGTPDEGAWRREYIAREQATWTPERRQAQEEELRRVEEYRQRRGPVPSGPSPAGSIPRAEVFARIGEAMSRLGAIWPSFLPPDPVWQDKVNAAAEGPRQTFLATVEQWETTETRRAEAYMYAIRRTVAGWPDEYRRRFSIMVEGFMRAERGQGITVRALSKNAAISKAFFDLRPFIPDDTPADPPAPDDGLPFHDLHPNTREILLRHWNTWDAARRARFEQNVRDVMKQTRYNEGNACAFILQTAGPVAPARKPALSPEEKEALHKIMWPTPPSSPQQEPKSTVPGPDIAKLVSRWPKALRMKYAGLVGRYSNEMPLVEAMARAYAELQSTAKEN